MGNSTSSIARSSSTSSQSQTLQYRIAASFVGKSQLLRAKTSIYSYNASALDSKESVFTGRPRSGQDAFFITNIGSSSAVAFGVADGVGGWMDSGVDPADFSHGLCRHWTDTAKETTAEAEASLGVRDLLQEGYDRLVADDEVSAGGSTACLAIAQENGTLQTAK